MIVRIEDINTIDTSTNPYTGEQCIFIDETVEIHTDKEGWGYLRDCCTELLGQKEHGELESDIETLVARIETLESNLNDYIDKFGKLDGGKEDE